MQKLFVKLSEQITFIEITDSNKSSIAVSLKIQKMKALVKLVSLRVDTNSYLEIQVCGDIPNML